MPRVTVGWILGKRESSGENAYSSVISHARSPSRSTMSGAISATVWREMSRGSPFTSTVIGFKL